MKRIDKIKNMTVEEMAREIIRLNFTDEYCDNGCPDCGQRLDWSVEE